MLDAASVQAPGRCQVPGRAGRAEEKARPKPDRGQAEFLKAEHDEGAHVGCQSGLRPRDTPHGLILFLVSTYLPIP